MLRINLYSLILFVGAMCSFVCCLADSRFFNAGSDTLIIDADTIFIEREQVSLSDDSLFNDSANDAPRKRHPWSASFFTGINLTEARIIPNSNEFLPLNDFLGSPYKPMANLSIGTDCGYRFLRLPSNRGSIELSASAGYFFNKIVIGYTGIRNPAELQEDSIEFFSADGGVLNMGYFVVTGAPGNGEVDTAIISLNSPKISYRTHDAVVKLRATLDLGQRNLRCFAETGVIRRFVRQQSSAETFYFFDEDGSYQVLLAKQVRPSNMLVPHIALGIERSFESGLFARDKFFTIGATISASAPSSTVYNDELLSIELRSFSLHAFGRFFF